MPKKSSIHQASNFNERTKAMSSKKLSITAAICISLATFPLFFVSPALGDGTEQPVPIEAKSPPDALKKAIDDAILKVKPALVRIFVVASRYENGRELKYEASGSGAIITKDGYVITNHHVAGRARQIVCTLSDKEEVAADLIGTDPLADIAVIKLRPDEKKEFPFAEFGDSSILRVGDRVLAMGSPLALSQSVTMGIVSNTEVVFPEFLPERSRLILEGENVGSIVRWIGHDAQIFGGNSGGPLVNLRGEIVGINEISIGISGAIPGNQAKDVAEKLIKFGKVSRSWFGLDIQPLLRHVDHKKGALVSGVMKGGPAEKAGFMPGDILVKIAGKDVDVSFPEEIPIVNQMMMDIPVGSTVDAVVQRDDKEIVLSVTSQEREYVMPKNAELFQWGMTARNLSLMDSKEMKRDNRDGVMVTSVRPGGPCREGEPKIAAGDVIVLVNGVTVKNMEELQKLSSEITKDKDASVPVLVTFDREKERVLTVVKLRNKEESQEQGIDARKAWLPVATQVVTKEIAENLGVPGLRGMRITRVYPGCSAEKAGLKVGDVITGLNGEAVSPSSPEDGDLLDEMVHRYAIGTKVELSIQRGADKSALEVVLEQSPQPSKEMKKYTDKDFEFTVRDVCFMDDANEDTGKDCSGVLVESVSEGGWASLARLSIGDLILAVDGRPVAGTVSFEREMKRAMADKPKSVVFKVQRAIHTMFIELEPAKADVK